ncbi:hypothetical protein [Paludisphaera mucosa]|uniref:Uncharacterized protein n=1 Tax=Paludisphaera mucosa TaxID=3030827 RepID=A0ABT6FJV6_9BACT|nr:hypothetical protein [Paludisphaera mucosa]MDG3007835.1 hypothetical protein [Paludisphaera mucosa]
MRQLGDLLIWVGMIVLTVGVVYFTPVVAEYVTAEPKPASVSVPQSGPRIHQTMLQRHRDFGEGRPSH